EGTIPEGQYGAGTVEIWDEGTYERLEWSDEVIRFALHGRRLRGTYSLVRFRRKGPRDWLLFRRGDASEPPSEGCPGPDDRSGGSAQGPAPTSPLAVSRRGSYTCRGVDGA